MTTWTEVDAKLDLFLDDADPDSGDRTFSVPLRIESWNWAQRLLCRHTPRQRQVQLTIESSGREAILPDDFFAADAIYDSDQEIWWRPMRRLPGDIRYTDEELPEFWVWGDRLFLEDEVTSDDYLTLYYWAYYPEVEYTASGTDDATLQQETIHTPKWAELAIVHLTVATCMMPMEIFAADINQYKIKIDAGTPLHNPRAESAKFHLWWWNVIMDSFPAARTQE